MVLICRHKSRSYEYKIAYVSADYEYLIKFTHLIPFLFSINNRCYIALYVFIFIST